MPTNHSIAQAITADGGFLPSDAGGASSTSEFQFSKDSSRFILKAPGSDALKNKPIRVKAWGRVTGGTTVNFTAKIDVGSSATIGSNTTIADSGAIAVNSVSGSWLLVAEGVWDATSNKFQGKYHGYVNGTAKTDTIFADVTTPGADPSDEDGLAFTVTGTFSGSNASNAAILDGFELEVL